MVKARFLLGLGVLLAGACTPRAVKDFSSLHDSEDYRQIQSRIYNGDTDSSLVADVMHFYDCSEYKAKDFLIAQKRVYDAYEKTEGVRERGDYFLDGNERINLELEFDEKLEVLRKIILGFGVSEEVSERFDSLEQALEDFR